MADRNKPTQQRVKIAGCKVVLRFAEESDPTVLPNIKKILYGQCPVPTRLAKAAGFYRD